MLEATASSIQHLVYDHKYWWLFFLFAVINFVVLQRGLADPGVILSGDFTRAEDFSRWVSSYRYPLWNEHGQSSTLETLSQLGIYSPAIIISSVIEIPSTVVYLVYFGVLGSLSGVFSFKLAEYVMVRQKLKPHFGFLLASSLFFMFATFVVETTNHPAIAFSFYLSPLLLYVLIRGVEENRTSYLLLSSLIYSLMTAAYHFLIFGLIIILSYILYDLFFKIIVDRFRIFSALKRASWYALIVVGPFIALSSYWLVPNLVYAGLELYPLVRTASDYELLYRYADIINIFSVKGTFNSGEVYPYTESERAYINILSITLTILAVSSLVLYKPNKLVLYLAILLVISVIISVIPHYLPDLYNWLVFDAPGSFLYSWVFRAPRFFHFMSISIAVLLSLSGLRIYQILHKQKKQFSKAVPAVFISIILVLSLIPNYILLTGDFNGSHRGYELPGYYTDMLAFLEKQDGSYKSIWGPPYSGGSNSTWHDKRIANLEEQISPVNTFSGQETLNNYIYPIIFGIRAPYLSLVYDGKTDNLNEFLSPINVKYIVLHNDIPTIINATDLLSTAISKQKGLLESNEFGPITVYTIKDTAGHLSIKQNTMLIQGGGLLEFDSAFGTESINSNNTGVLFSDMSLDQNPKMWNISDTLIPENQLSYAEYMLNKIDVIVIQPSAHTDQYDPRNVWSKSSATQPIFLNLLNRAGIDIPFQFDYGKNIIFTSANNSQLAIPLSVSDAGEYKVLLRYFANERGGLLDLDLAGNPKTLNTTSNVNRFIWTDLGTVGLSKGTQTLSIENRNGLNAVNLIALIPAEKYENYKTEFVNSLLDKDIIHIFEAESDFNFDEGSSLAVIRSMNYSNGRALELSNQVLSSEFEILKDGNYNLTIYGKGRVRLAIDGIMMGTISLAEASGTHIEPIALNSGNHSIEIAPITSLTRSYLDSIFMHWIKAQDGGDVGGQSRLVQKSGEDPIIRYHKISPTNYELTVKAESPFMLAFAEAYDERWTAEVEERSTGTKKIYKPLPLYGAINGFEIDTEGEHVINIKYAPQEIFYVSAWISAVSYALVIVYLVRANNQIFPRVRNIFSR
jgi:uncharacterized membrane protein